MAAPLMTPPAAARPFLDAAGWEGATFAPLAGDASFRRYFRVERAGERAVLMDAPPPHEDPRPFIAMAEYLQGIGLSAPRILARDLDHGLLLLEDFGDDRLREALDDAPEREGELYTELTDLLVALHAAPTAANLKPHGLEHWLDEVELFPAWYAPAVGLHLDGGGYRDAWREVLQPVDRDGLARVTELRDFHAENIMLLDGREGAARFGLLDFQDAQCGHPAYDLVSLLQDARRDVSPAVERASLARYMAATRQGDAFERAYWALAAQRNVRILGVFCRLWKRDGKEGYRRFQPRMWGLVERDLAHPTLAPLKAWFDANVPLSARADAWRAFA